MPNCPFCKANLTQVDFDAGKCSSCSGVLPSGKPRAEVAVGSDPSTPEGMAPRYPVEPDARTADERRIAQTLEAGAIPPEPPAERQSGTADERRIAQTLEAGAIPPEPPAERQSGTADERRIAQTLEAGSGALPPSEARPTGTADERRVAQTLDAGGAPAADTGWPGADDSRRYAKTFDTGEFSGDIAERVSMMWSGKYQPEATPRTSIKAATQALEAQANLVIPPRVVRDVKEAGPSRADYEVLSQLGEGGMGVVLAARQASIDRTVAVKMLKPAGAKDLEARRKFLSEAVVTGDLEHPNIVPIYDLGKDESGALFYSMKRVKGTPWDTVIAKKTFQENIEILMKIADAVAFAHSRGVVHRDLKPENVMLGDYGEVLLMDWGLALTVGEGNTTAGMAGTPAYMAPEMASGPIDRIGFASDIYLLGAILYEIITGNPPHTGKNVMECLFAAAKNEIRPTDKSGELVAIALKAMATQPEHRYASVGELQEAIRQYQSHSESISLSTRAEEDLKEARQRDDYEIFARAMFGFQEAYSLWEGNARAKQGMADASLAYAQSALGKGDYDLGASLLDPANPAHAELLRQIKVAQRERDARQQRLKWAIRVGAGLVVTVLVVITVAFFWIRAEAQAARAAELVAQNERQAAVAQKERADQEAEEARKQRAEAVKQRDIATRQTEIANQKTDEARKAQKTAEEQRAEAVKQKNLADQQRALADEQRALAVAAQKKEEYEAYIARIGLAAAKIEENAFEQAKALLQACPAELRDWEWGRLMHLCTQEVREFDAQQPIDAVAFSHDGKRFVTGGWGGTARIWDVESGKQLLAIPTGGQYVFAVAFSPDGKHVATGTNVRPDYVRIWDAATGKLVRGLSGHRDAVLSVAYSRDGARLLTSSYDNTARLWDLQSGQSQVFQGHEWWVWCAAFSPDEQRIVTACQDGSAMVWSVATAQPGSPFLGHTGPVYTAAFSPDGKRVATGGYDKRILVWEPDEVKPFDFEALGAAGQAASPSWDVLEGHTAGVRSVRFSANGKLLVSGANDNTLRVWDVATRKTLKTLRGHAGRVLACVFAPDGERLLSGSHDQKAKLWSIAGYEEVRVFQGLVLEGHRDAILGADFSFDGRQIVSASRDRTAKTWDAATGKEIRQFREGHEFLATTAKFFPDGKKLLTAAVDNTTRIWDVATGTQLRTLDATGPSAAAALSRDGALILTGSDDKSAKLWDAETGKLLRKLVGHRAEVTAVAVSPDAKLLFTGDARGRGRLWDAATGQTVWECAGHSRNITAAFFTPDGERVLTASTDNTVSQWEARSGREQLSWILRHPDAVTSMAVSPDGQRVLTTCADRQVRLWDLASAHEIGRLGDGAEMVNAAAFSPDGRLAVTTSGSGTVRLWDLEKLDEVGTALGGRRPFLTPRASGSQAWSAVFSPDGAYLATVGGNDARLWDVKSGREGVHFSPHGSVASARFSPDGKHIVTGSWDNTARIWNAQSGLAERKLEGGHTQYVNDAAFSPVDPTKVLTASDDKTAKLWDVTTGRVVARFVGHEGRVRTAVFSSDGQRVLTASNDKTARIWDAATGKCLRVLKGHEQAVLCAAFSSDGKRVITGGEDNRAKLWEADTGKELPFALEGHTAAVTSVAFSPDGRRALTGSQDITAKLWDATTGKEILTLKGHAQEITTVGFSPDGRSALSGSRDGTLVLWLTSPWRAAQPATLTRSGTPAVAP